MYDVVFECLLVAVLFNLYYIEALTIDVYIGLHRFINIYCDGFGNFFVTAYR